jgi:hypothetical protein
MSAYRYASIVVTNSAQAEPVEALPFSLSSEKGQAFDKLRLGG